MQCPEVSIHRQMPLELSQPWHCASTMSFLSHSMTLSADPSSMPSSADPLGSVLSRGSSDCKTWTAHGVTGCLVVGAEIEFTLLVVGLSFPVDESILLASLSLTGDLSPPPGSGTRDPCWSVASLQPRSRGLVWTHHRGGTPRALAHIQVLWSIAYCC